MTRNLTLSLADLADAKIARAFKIVRNLNPNITLPEIRQCSNDFSPVANWLLASSSIEDYVANLIAVRDVANELHEHDIQSKMSDAETGLEIRLTDLDSWIEINSPFLSPELSPSVFLYLETLNASDWFASLGKPVEENVNVVHDYSPDTTLTYICVGIQNSIVEMIMDRTGCHHACLTPLFSKLNEILDGMMAAKLNKTPATMLQFDPNDVRGLILHACLEMEYPDGHSAFATECCQWITRGKLPIGWNGAFPDGKLVLT
ncbi:hypothetical protein [Novipirellula caenicola]|uniref:Uncharacterized protein n=1 Tax=Novipirellula caenicola TaxID=1536901 RepID=A0ABP9VK88_9BACT